jgi:5-methyltetrahydrofolate--homocysteine methyltransferase
LYTFGFSIGVIKFLLIFFFFFLQYESQLDDYRSIMAKAIADRLAEAFAELMHLKVRQEHWGYAADETMNLDQMLKVKYQGIRPAPGYPTQPDHLEKGTMWKLMKAQDEIGVLLTESMAMMPAASVSGLYLAHSESEYFSLGQISKDQVEDYANRKGMAVAEIERWLSSQLSYDP